MVELLRSVPPSAARVFHQKDFAQLLAAGDSRFAERLDDLIDEQLALRIAEPSQLLGGANGVSGGASGGLGVSSLPDAVEVARLFVWNSGREASVLHWTAACEAQPGRSPTAAELALPLCPICARAGLGAAAAELRCGGCAAPPPGSASALHERSRQLQ